MIGLDTNVLVRFLTQDDPEQAAISAELIASLTEDAPGFVGREVIVEMVWVLERAYRLSRDQIADTLDGLLGASEIILEAADRVAIAADRYRKGRAGFADQMIALTALTAGCERTVTFDKEAAASSDMELLGYSPSH